MVPVGLILLPLSVGLSLGAVAVWATVKRPDLEGFGFFAAVFAALFCATATAVWLLW